MVPKDVNSEPEAMLSGQIFQKEPLHIADIAATVHNTYSHNSQQLNCKSQYIGAAWVQ